MKRLLSLLLVFTMLLALFPTTTAVAATTEDTEFAVGSLSDVKPGDTITVPVNVVKNPGFMAVTLQLTYDDAFELTAMTQGSALSGTYTMNPENGKCVFLAGSDVDSTGEFFTATFTVTEEAVAGKSYSIGLTCEALGNLDEAEWEPTLTPGTITIYQETTGLSYANGTQEGIDETWVQKEYLGKNGYDLTTPGEGTYYFAGWFKNLPSDYLDENGFYVISDLVVSENGISGVSGRPYYDDSLDGAYHALWIKGDYSYALVVHDKTFDVVVAANDTAALTNAISTAAGEARVQLVKNMTTTSTVTASTKLHLDLNGYAITNTSAALLTITADGAVIESSRAGGKLDNGSKTQTVNSWNNVVAMVRDITITGANLVFRGQFQQIENCVINASSTSNYSSAILFCNSDSSCPTTGISNCEITTSGCNVLQVAAGQAVTLTDCNITSSTKKVFTGSSTSALNLTGTNTLEATNATTLFNNIGTVYFGSTTGSYQISADATSIGTVTCLEGYSVNLTDGAVTVDKKITIGDTEVSGSAELEITEESTSVTAGAADDLAELHKLTVNSQYADLTFLADALDSIAALADGDVSISIKEATAEEGEVARVSLDVLNSNSEKVDFRGEVQVSIPFAPAEGVDVSNYKVYFVDNGTRQAMTTTISGDETNGYVATFTAKHFSDYAVADASSLSGYISGLNTTTATVPAGQTVTVNVKVSHTDTENNTLFNAAELVLSYDSSLLTFAGVTGENGAALEGVTYKVDGNTLTIEDFGADKNFGEGVYVLKFTTVTDVTEATETVVALTSAKFIHKENANSSNLVAAVTLDPAELEITIDVEAFDVGYADDQVTGNSQASKGEDFTFSVTDYSVYEYTVTVTVGGKTLAAEFLTDNGDGTYTIAGEQVTGDISITYTRTAKSFTVSFSDSGAEDVLALNPSLVATYGVNYTFTLPEKDQYLFTMGGVTIGGTSKAYANEDGTITIDGSLITGDVVITVYKTQVEYNVTITGTAQESVTVTQTAEPLFSGAPAQLKKVTMTVAVTTAAGYTYEVKGYKTADTTATAEFTLTDFTDNGDGTYTYSKVIDCDYTIEVNKVLNGAVAITKYLTLDADADGYAGDLYLVTYYAELDEGNVATYDGTAMYWSDKYTKDSNTGAWVCLIAVNGTMPSENELLAAITVRALNTDTNEAVTNVSYEYDVNATGTVDAADAQYVYNMYNTMYAAIDGNNTMLKFLEADVNGDRKIDSKDAQAIINNILGITETN